MPNSSKPYLNFVIEPELLKRIDDFRFRSRFPTRASGIKWLLDWALQQEPLSEQAVQKLVRDPAPPMSDVTIHAGIPGGNVSIESASLHTPASAGTVLVLGILPAIQHWQDALDSQHAACVQYAGEIELLLQSRQFHIVCEDHEGIEASIAEETARKHGCDYVKINARRERAHAWQSDERERYIVDRTRIATIGNQRSAIVICNASLLPGVARLLAKDCKSLVIRNLITESSAAASLAVSVT